MRVASSFVEGTAVPAVEVQRYARGVGAESGSVALLRLSADKGFRRYSPKIFWGTRTAVSCCGCASSTLSPRMIRGDKVAVVDLLRFTAVRVGGKRRQADGRRDKRALGLRSVRAVLKNLCRRLKLAGHSPAPSF